MNKTTSRKYERRIDVIEMPFQIPHSATEQQYLSALERLQQKPNAKVVVLFVRADHAEGVLRAAKELKRKHRGRYMTF